MTQKTRARIIGMGRYLPAKVLSNADLEKMVDTTDEWIVSRTGIKERRLAAADEPTSFMGLKAAEEAIQNAGIDKQKIDLVICATMTPDYLSSSTAALIQKGLGLSTIAAFDMQAACTGYIYALAQAKAFIESGLYQNILIVAAEKMSSVIDYEDRNTCILFGDGASAALISTTGKGLLIDTVTLGADGDLSHLIQIPAGGSRQPANAETVTSKGHFVKMEGKEVYKHAVRRMAAAIQNCLKHAGLQETDLSWLVPHQANKRIIESIAGNFHIPDERIFITLHKYGNTSASSVGIALAELAAEHPPQAGDHLLLVAFGAGLTWGASILTQTELSND